MEEWQTRTPQKRLPERACGFKSRSRHSTLWPSLRSAALLAPRSRRCGPQTGRLGLQHCAHQSPARHSHRRSPHDVGMADVEVRRQGYVAEVVLTRVAAHNALSTAMMAALRRACADVADDRGVRVAVLASDDPHMFCVGA